MSFFKYKTSLDQHKFAKKKLYDNIIVIEKQKKNSKTSSKRRG